VKLADLNTNPLAAIQVVRWDRCIEQHEGPETRDSVSILQTPLKPEIAAGAPAISRGTIVVLWEDS
jgi:hypothetical protein